MSEIKVLIEGYTSGETNGRSCSTVVLIKDDFDGVEMNIVVDPGTLSSQQALIDELKKEGVKPKDVDIVVITHSHMDHYANIGMFSNAKSLSFDVKSSTIEVFNVAARADASSSSPATTSLFIESNVLRTELNSALDPAKLGVLKSAILIPY